MGGRVLWITGLPGSGKSTLADALRERHPGFVLLRMDDFRKIVTPAPTYAEAERETVYRAIVFTAKTLADLGHDVIIDATGNMRRWRDLARSMIPRYAEVYLSCPIHLCRDREQRRKETFGAPRDIYKKGAEGWPVPGVSTPYEEPERPEIIVDTGRRSVEEVVGLVESLLQKMPSSP